jgi:hypothetical protein
MRNRVLCAAALVLSCTASNKEAKPVAAAFAEPAVYSLVPPAPPAKVAEVVETHAGITSRDPYRWMETQGEPLKRWEPRVVEVSKLA